MFHRFGDGIWFHFWYFVETLTARARNLQNIQKPIFLQWMHMILHIRKNMIFMKFVATCFGIDLCWFVVSNLLPFEHVFVIIPIFVRDRLCLVIFRMVFFLEVYGQLIPKGLPRSIQFGIQIHTFPHRGLLENPSAQFGTLLVRFGYLLVSF